MSTSEQAINSNIGYEIAQRQRQTVLDQREALTASQPLRQVIGNVATVLGLNSSNFTAYENFTGLRRAMGQTFDFRAKPDGSYGERWEAEEHAKDFLVNCTPELGAQIYEVASEFGLTGNSVPKNPNAHAGIVLGGAGRTPLERTRYTKELINSRLLVTDMAIGVGSERAVNDVERQRVAEYADDAQTEFDLMRRAFEHEFEVAIKEEDIFEWTVQDVRSDLPNKCRAVGVSGDKTAGRPDLLVVSSAIVTNPYRIVTKNGRERLSPRNRANTEDTFATLGRMGVLAVGDKAVVVTNAHFTPFQGAAAKGQLGRLGVETDVVGFDPKHFGNAPKRPDELLQEMLSTANSLERAILGQ